MRKDFETDVSNPCMYSGDPPQSLSAGSQRITTGGDDVERVSWIVERQLWEEQITLWGMDGILNLSALFREWRPSKLKIAMLDRAAGASFVDGIHWPGIVDLG